METHILSHPARGAWIEIAFVLKKLVFNKSHPARGAWIEILCVENVVVGGKVAPRKGCVD